ncbi:hypothetical protein CI238_13600 [Colletotrichum incanum]|uniref:Uncharacterized protein n=1 Tax=Colletotrichum incanum TaxID=1573173 RepID=A0A167ABA4_COLIC|nr:hypothetical protein CI238_13600 [Colletotrichum incanum]
MSSSDSDASDTSGASVASDTSVRSCIVVAIRPEDLTSACTTDLDEYGANVRASA